VARVVAQVKSYGICGGQCCIRADFLLLLWFPLPILIPLLLHAHNNLSSGAGIIVEIVEDIPPKIKKKKQLKAWFTTSD
jgi:hypothetical protein